MKHSVLYTKIKSVFPLNGHKKGRVEQGSKIIFPHFTDNEPGAKWV